MHSPQFLNIAYNWFSRLQHKKGVGVVEWRATRDARQTGRTSDSNASNCNESKQSSVLLSVQILQLVIGLRKSVGERIDNQSKQIESLALASESQSGRIDNQSKQIEGLALASESESKKIDNQSEKLDGLILLIDTPLAISSQPDVTSGWLEMANITINKMRPSSF